MLYVQIVLVYDIDISQEITEIFAHGAAWNVRTGKDVELSLGPGEGDVQQVEVVGQDASLVLGVDLVQSVLFHTRKGYQGHRQAFEGFFFFRNIDPYLFAVADRPAGERDDGYRKFQSFRLVDGHQ